MLPGIYFRAQFLDTTRRREYHRAFSCYCWRYLLLCEAALIDEFPRGAPPRSRARESSSLRDDAVDMMIFDYRLIAARMTPSGGRHRKWAGAPPDMPRGRRRPMMPAAVR